MSVPVSRGGLVNDGRLEKGILLWRQRVLQSIEDRLQDINEEYRDVQDGMAIAWRNSGEVDEDVVEALWDKLNSCATERCKLETEHEELMDLDLPHLIVSFQRSKKIKTWPIWPLNCTKWQKWPKMAEPKKNKPKCPLNCQNIAKNAKNCQKH